MKINAKCDQKFLCEKNVWIDYLINSEGFKRSSNSPHKLFTRSSKFSANPNYMHLEVDLSQFPNIEITVNNLFFNDSKKSQLALHWFASLEERVFVWSKTGKQISSPKVSFLSSQTYQGFAELVSRLVVPVGLLLIFNMVIFTLLLYAMIKGIINEIQFDESSPPTYFSFAQVKPSVLMLYQDNITIMKSAFLGALLGGGILFGIQQLLVCLFLKVYGYYCKKVILCLIILGVLQGFLYFTVSNIELVLLFVPITIFSYFTFSFLSRKIPFYFVKTRL